MRPSADTLLLWSGAACVYGCAACPIDPKQSPDGLTLADWQAAAKSITGLAGRLAVVLGGEPCLRPDLLTLMAGIRAAGCHPGLVTTGQGLLFSRLRHRLRRIGLVYLRVQLFGVGDAHDRAVGVAGAFAKTMEGIRVWMREADGACDVDIALSTRGRGLTELSNDLELLASQLAPPWPALVVSVDPKDTPRLLSTPGWKEHVLAATSRSNPEEGPSVVWEGLPDAPPGSVAISLPRPAFVAPSPPACCLGTRGDILRARAMSPERVVANSFNFLRTETTVPYTEEATTCTAWRAGSGYSPQRTLWLIEGERLVLHATDTGDFSAAEIQRIKDEWSHLFVDCALPGVLDDFTEGMRRALPDAVCEDCPHQNECGRRYRRIEGPPFAREEAWIKGFLANLRGNVLDVGCGEQLYRAEIGRRLGTGSIRYTGIDPDAISLSHARAALPTGRFLQSGIETFPGVAAAYDHILCLRALNHVADLDEALARMAKLLRPGGTLLLVETTPFAMLRRRLQVEAADRAPRAGHQHLRNLTSDEVLPFARRRGLTVLEHRPVGRDNTNEWILWLQRPHA